MSYMNTLIHETSAELTKSLRSPEFSLPTLILPVAFYSLFGLMMSNGPNSATYLLATYGVFAVMGPAIFGFGAGIANERELGWLSLKQAAPVSASSIILSKLINTVLFATASLLPIYILASWFGEVRLSGIQWVLLYAVHIATTIPMVLIGLGLGLRFSTNGAVAMCNLIFLTLAAIGGLWLPVFLFPDFLKAIAAALPSYHLSEIALSIVNAAGEHNAQRSLVAITVTTILLLGITIATWKNQGRFNHG